MTSTIVRGLAILSLTWLAILPSQAADDLAALERRVAALEGDMQSLKSVVNDNASQIGKLSELVGQAVTELTDQGARQQSILDSITSRDDAGEVYLPLSSIMDKSAAARQEVRRAVEQSIRTEGTLAVENEMGTAQDVLVNRVQYRVQPGATLSLKVPVGTVSTQLPGQEIVNWAIGVPNYSQSVSIKPRHNTARVGSEWTSYTVPVSTPVYYETPTYYSYGDPWWSGYVFYP